MSKKEEALKLAREAFENIHHHEWGGESQKQYDARIAAVAAIREALVDESSGTEQPGQWIVPQTAEQISDFIGSDYVWREHKVSDVVPHEDDQYCVTAHDLISAFERLADHIGDANKMAEQPVANQQLTTEQQDLPNLIAGALGVSRGTAYDMMREALAGVQEPEPQRWAAYLEGDERVTCYDTEGEACSEQECEIDNYSEPGDVVEYLVAPMLSAKQVLRTRDAYWFGDRFVEEVNNDLADEMGAEDSPLSIDKEGTEALGKLVMDFLCAHGKTQWWMVDHKREEKRTYVAGSDDEAAQSKGDA